MLPIWRIVADVDAENMSQNNKVDVTSQLIKYTTKEILKNTTASVNICNNNMKQQHKFIDGKC